MKLTEILQHRIDNLEIELRDKEYQRSKMLGGSLLSENLDNRILDLKELIGKLSQEKRELIWQEVISKSK